MKFQIDTENKVLTLETDLTTEQLSQLVKTHKLQGYTIKSVKEHTYKNPPLTPHNNGWAGNGNVGFGGPVTCISDNMYYSDAEGTDTRVLLKG